MAIACSSWLTMNLLLLLWYERSITPIVTRKEKVKILLSSRNS
jgi:hypothetical protein